jgi:hypothetical protein
MPAACYGGENCILFNALRFVANLEVNSNYLQLLKGESSAKLDLGVIL